MKKLEDSLIQKIYPIVIIILVFLVGYFYSKTTALDAQKGKTQVANNAGQTATVAPQPTPDLAAAPVVTDKDHIRGSKDAPVVLIEYSDYECPFCKTFHPTMNQVMKDYGNKVAWVYRHYPLPFHQNAQKEAEASECVNELGGNDAFWKFSDAIFERTTSNGTGFALTDLGPLAAELGVDQAAFQSCLDSGKYTSLVQNDETGGQKAGIQGTPGTIIVAKNGARSLIPEALPFDQVKPMIDAALK